MDADRTTPRDQVGRDRGDGAGDRRRGGPADLLDREVEHERDRPPGAHAVHSDLLHVGAPLGRADTATADVRRGEAARRDRDPVQFEGHVAVEAELEEHRDPTGLVGWVADLEHDVGDVDGSGQRDRLGMRDDVDLLLAVRLREGDRLLAAERGPLHEDPALEHDRGAGARVEPGDDDPRRRPERVRDVRVQADRVDRVEAVGSRAGPGCWSGRAPRHSPARSGSRPARRPRGGRAAGASPGSTSRDRPGARRRRSPRR